MFTNSCKQHTVYNYISPALQNHMVQLGETIVINCTVTTVTLTCDMYYIGCNIPYSITIGLQTPNKTCSSIEVNIS